MMMNHRNVVNNIPLLLTATVNPQGMQGASFHPEERALMYIEALNFYIQELSRMSVIAHTRLCEYNRINDDINYIVFAENSGCDSNLILSHLLHADCVQVEYLKLDPSDFDIAKGKGYNEMLLLNKAVAQSEAIAKAGCFFKITGRLKILNIVKMLQECAVRSAEQEKIGCCDDTSLRFLADCKDHRVYEWLHLPINGHAGECRYWYASKKFYLDNMAQQYVTLNDYTNPPILAEDLMLKFCREFALVSGCKVRFKTQALISGKGGHLLGKGCSFFYSTDNDSLVLRSKCALRQCLRWMFPWWKV